MPGLAEYSVPFEADSVEKYPDPLARLAVLVSGRGSNLEAILRAQREGRATGEVVVVVSNSEGAGGLEVAARGGVETLVIPHGRYQDRQAFDLALVAALRERGVQYVLLAGFMRRLGPAFCQAFPDATLNIHPSLLPAFPGAHAQRQALEHGVTISGATVHFVTPELDDGPIVLQVAVPVLADDTEQTLSARILEAEHRLYPEALTKVLAGGWRIEGRRVRWGDGVR